MTLRANPSLGASLPVVFRCKRLDSLGFVQRVCLILLILLLTLQTAIPASAAHPAQATPSLEILSIDTREFPLIRAEIKARNLPADATAPMTAASISILENGNPIPARDVQENYQGIHLVLAVNPDFALDSRDPKGVSRYTKLVGAFKQMEGAFSAEGKDRFSLFINPDYVYEQLSDFGSLATALEAYDGNFRTLKSDLASLTRAIDALSMDESGKDKLLLYITGLPSVQDAKSIQLLSEIAREKNIKVVIWLAGEAFVTTYPQIPYLQDLADSGAGSLFVFSGSEPLPEAVTYPANMGRTYLVSYLSLARESGKQTLALRLQTESGTLTSASSNFEVQVEPARLSFLSLPEALSLKYSAEGAVTPAELPLEVLVDFVDGHPRNINSARLLVNGTVVQENTQAPLNSFVLKLSEYTGLEQLSLQVLMVDALGLEAQTPLARIALINTTAETPGGAGILKNPWYLVILGAVLAGFLALVILPGLLRNKRQAAPVPLAETISPAPADAPIILATLTKLNADNLPTPDKPIAITQEITIIGRDPDLCNLVLNDPAVEAMHCQLRMLPDGEFRLTDFRSAAGSWVNYAPVGVKGIRLQHGDLIQLGLLTFRFGSGSRVAATEKNQAERTPSDSNSEGD